MRPAVPDKERPSRGSWSNGPKVAPRAADAHRPAVWYAWAANLVLATHGAFVLFVVFGGLLAARWPRVRWVHVPALAWGALIEFGGWICPLTPLENELRALAGHAGYAGGFVEHYLLAWLYPAGLTREVQVALGLAVLAVNAAAYAWVASRARVRRTRAAR